MSFCAYICLDCISTSNHNFDGTADRFYHKSRQQQILESNFDILILFQTVTFTYNLFSVNAMSADVDGTLYDYFDGKLHLQNKQVSLLVKSTDYS